MNQILATSQTTNRRGTRGSKGPVEIEKILKFFAISLIIFGVFLIGSGSYAMYKNNETKKNVVTKPVIEEELKGEDTVILKVTHNKEIDSVEYYWNDEEPSIIKGNGRKYIEQEITIPGGKNTLYVKAIDVEGQEISQPKEYITPDIIKLEIAGDKLKVIADNETEISYMTYRWNDNDEERVDINDTKVEEEVTIPKGENTITIILVDKNNKTIMKKQKVKGVMKPTISVTLDDDKEYFVITAKDEIALDKMEFVITNSKINGKRYRLRAKNNEKELEYKFKLEPGENYIEAIAYSADGVTSNVKKAKANK